MNKINCFVPFSGAAQAEKTVKGLQETGLVNNIYLLALPDVTENLPGCSTAHAIHPVQHCYEVHRRT